MASGARGIHGLSRRLALCGAFASLAIAAPTADIELSARVEPSVILAGDAVRYVVTVTRPAGARADLPAVRGNTGRLDVEGYRVDVDTLTDGRVRETHALSLTAWIPGRDTLPPQRVEVRSAEDTTATTLYTPATIITVRATAPRNAKDIADIRDARRLPRSLPWGVPLLFVVIVAAWYLRRALRHPPKPAPVITEAVVAPEELAIGRLLGLDAAALASREFAFALSEILRAYLANRFRLDALEATTGELLERVKPLSWRAGREAWLRDWCESLDLAKFADAALPADDRARLVEEARAFVLESAPLDSSPVKTADTAPHPPEGTPDAGRPA